MNRQALWLLRCTEQEMRDYYEERKEAWQESEKGAAFAERIEAVESAVNAVEELPP